MYCKFDQKHGADEILKGLMLGADVIVFKESRGDYEVV